VEHYGPGDHDHGFHAFWLECGQTQGNVASKAVTDDSHLCDIERIEQADHVLRDLHWRERRCGIRRVTVAT
jgi:hypothetical protein